MPWYERYFTADYWAYADAEYTAERTAVEVAYLASVLDRYAPAGRVLDLGCGVGRHAIGLARRGFAVTGVDLSGYALARAANAAAEAGVPLALRRADVLGASDWGVSDVDAVICVQAFGWGSDADQLRMLRRIRRLLAPGGVLLLDHSNILAITRAYRPEGHAEIGDTSFHFIRRYDPISGRSGGEVRVRRADGSTAVLPDDVRMYQPVEVRSLLRRAGFTIAATDAEFTAGAPVTLASRYVQFVAEPVASMTSALVGHRSPVPIEGVDLRWAPDEAEFVAAPLAAAWAEVNATGPDPGGIDRVRRYDLVDPFGAARVTGVLAAQLRRPPGALGEARVSIGAGVTGLLHDLARLADGGAVLIDTIGHPHLAEAAEAAGDEVRIASLASLPGALAAVAAHRPAVTVLDRPGLVGRRWSVDDVRVLASATAAVGGVLVVDETCDSYAPPGGSVAVLTEDVDGLIVLRGMSKGYCCGGLRVGFAIVSADLAVPVRDVLAPLAVGALAVDTALALLRHRDPLAALRDRIAEVKPSIAALLVRAGFAPVETDPRVPWFVLPADDRIRLAARGLVAKDVPVRRPDGGRSALSRLSVPLSVQRREAVETALSTGFGR